MISSVDDYSFYHSGVSADEERNCSSWRMTLPACQETTVAGKLLCAYSMFHILTA